ncbi:MAG: serine/threonine protein kinase [Mycobacterium sp.]|uniref:serine/threonine-protein kinase n=1 Tax=Mycobacterium sp. TaxID=1785 RepID=UPI001EC2FAA2|nr:serine/threonine-protein kinase [Mycobacterium sp.]MBW0017842.1 serine/threonine protein kinase [Mycobacterium sp.]
MPLAVGEVFAGYTILRVLGAGGMGTVYLAQHPRLPRRDALKVLSVDLTADPQFRARFVREADIAASLWHPNILGIHDRGEVGDQFWISMDFVGGTDGARLLRERFPGGMPVGLAMQIITAVGSALDHAHDRGLLHRDVKPANILISDPGSEAQRVFLADFGIARPMEDTAGLTATNVAIGTFAYAAPEQLMGEPIDGRADQYALACSAFHFLAGAPPFEHPSAAAVISKHVLAPPPPIGGRRPELAPLEPVFSTAMAKRPADRFARCQDFTAHLQHELLRGATGLARHNQVAPGSTMLDYKPNQYTPLAPVSPAPLVPLPPPHGKQPRRRTPVLVGAVLGVALLVAAGIYAAVKFTGRHGSPAAAPPTSAAPTSAAPNTGPFTGTYRSDYSEFLGPGLDGGPVKGSTPSTATWGLRSVCRPTGCVATASYVSGGKPELQTMVFDDVGGSWLSVGLITDTCLNAAAEFWMVVILQPRPDGTLFGEATKTSAGGCSVKRTVTFTRTGDVDVNSVADPASQAPRVVSPAEALHGRYHETVVSGASKYQQDWAVRTDCLRTGERCMTFFHAPPDQVKPLVFADGNWIFAIAETEKCPSGDASDLKRNGQFPLPQPLQNPITLLTGRFHQEQSGSCAGKFENDDKFERTGD